MLAENKLPFSIWQIKVWLVRKRIPVEAVPLQFAAVSDVEDERSAVKHKSLYMLKQGPDLELYRFVDFDRSISRGKNDAVVVVNDEVDVLQVTSGSKVKGTSGIYEPATFDTFLPVTRRSTGFAYGNIPSGARGDNARGVLAFVARYNVCVATIGTGSGHDGRSAAIATLHFFSYTVLRYRLVPNLVAFEISATLSADIRRPCLRRFRKQYWT